MTASQTGWGGELCGWCSLVCQSSVSGRCSLVSLGHESWTSDQSRAEQYPCIALLVQPFSTFPVVFPRLSGIWGPRVGGGGYLPTFPWLCVAPHPHKKATLSQRGNSPSLQKPQCLQTPEASCPHLAYSSQMHFLGIIPTPPPPSPNDSALLSYTELGLGACSHLPTRAVDPWNWALPNSDRPR